MKSKKALIWLFAAAVAVAVAGGAITFGVISIQERKLGQDLELARGFLGQKKLEDASRMIESVLERGKGTERWYAEALAIKLRLAREQGDFTGADATALALTDSARGFKGRPVAEARVHLAQAALDAGDADKARPHFDELLKQPPDNAYGVEAAKLGLLRIQMAEEGATPEVHKALSALLDEYPESPFREDIEFALGECNWAILFSPQAGEGDELYEIKKGDSIYGISRRFKTPQDVIMRLNGITNPGRLSIGQRLKIPKLDFSIVVDKSTQTMTLLNNGKFFKKYRIRCSKDESVTPSGDFRVQRKTIDPEWVDPKTGKRYPPGDPENELGTRFIGFQGSNYGIHGTDKPDLIGTPLTKGCVAMLQEDIEALFDLLPVGAPIKITGRPKKPAAETK